MNYHYYSYEQSSITKNKIFNTGCFHTPPQKGKYD